MTLGRRQLVHVADERDHDLGVGWPPACWTAICGVQDGPGLDLDEVGDHQAQAAAAQAQHRVLLAHRVDGGQQLACPGVLGIVLGRPALAQLGHLDQQVVMVGQELVERRVDQADHDRQAVHRLEDALEVALLEAFSSLPIAASKRATMAASSAR
jgi:hypothetical protein